MRIHMKSIAVGPRGSWQGDCECPDDQAQQFVAAGYAIALDPVETAVAPPVEVRAEAMPMADPGSLVPGFGKYANGEYKDRPLTLAEIRAYDPAYLDYLADKQEKDPAIAAAAKAVRGT